MHIILVYDIKTDDIGKKILHKVFKICKRYLYRIQNSVFEGKLTDSQLYTLKSELKPLIRKDTDSIVIYKVRDAKWVKHEFIGIVEDKTDNFI